MPRPPSLRILTYNVKLLPQLAKRFVRPLLGSRGFWEDPPHGLRDEERAEAIGAHIAEDPEGWDVVCFQEVFTRPAIQALRGALGPTYTFAGPFGGRPMRGRNHSGLFLASRLPIREVRFEGFRTASGSDRFCEKGVAHCTLDAAGRLPDLETLHLFHTHLQAWPRHRRARLSQMGHLRGFIEGRLGARDIDDRHGALLCGDLNVVAEEGAHDRPTGEYGALRRLLRGARDLFREAHPLAEGSTWDSSRNPHMTGDPPGKRERLDYVFAFDHAGDASRPLHGLRARSVDVLRYRHRGADLSDHFALGASLERRD